MESERLAAFSDGVLAIIITIMVLEVKPPDDGDWGALRQMLPDLLSYILSFIYVGIYWNNHHHLLQMVRRVNGAMLWANMHLLFWLSLVPLTTAWVREHHHATAPTACYGIVLLASALAYFILQRCIIRMDGADSLLRKALGHDLKGKLSPVFYAVGIAVSFLSPLSANLIYAGIALLWLVPDRRIEKHIG
jgi:uncharacterized membrane protein